MLPAPQLLLLLLASCSALEETRPAVESTPGAPIERIALARRWPGSNDLLVLRLSRSGEARCQNGWPTWPVRGEHVGALGDGDFAEVSMLIEDLALQELAGTLDPPRMFAGSVRLEWSRSDGTTTTLECDERWAPASLRAVALAAEAVGRRVSWQPVEDHDDTALPGGVPERYAFLFNLSAFMAPRAELASALPYDRIELERSECFGTCPAFVLQLHRDGRATWEGRAFTEPGGPAVGEVGLHSFARICWYVEQLDLERLAGSYRATWTCDRTTHLRLVKPDGETVVFEDYGDRAPLEVLVLADLLERIALQNGWRGVEVEKVEPIDAQVLRVDRALGSIVLDKGLSDGVRVGNTFDVFLGSQYKGMVRVESVQDATCTARILFEKGEIASGDSASTML